MAQIWVAGSAAQRAVLAGHDAVRAVEAVELDARALAAARRNIADRRMVFHCWMCGAAAFCRARLRGDEPAFPCRRADDVGLGRAFLQRARGVLRPGGVLWMVANRHLPYEAVLAELFAKVEAMKETGRFKIVRATA